jgi:BNR/Asp-box repeat
MTSVATSVGVGMHVLLRLGCGVGWWMLAIIPSAIQAVERSESYAIFKTIDRGRSWSPADAGMPGDTRINAFGAVDTSIFAGTDSGIYVSRDQGQSWNPSTGLAMTSGRILGFATLGQSLYVGTDRSGILVSSDLGMTWDAKAGLTSKKIRSLFADQGKLYVGTDGDGAFVTSDRGLSWTSMHQGLPAHAQLFALSAIRGRLFAALYSKGLYTWNEQQSQWIKVGTVAPLALAVVDDTLIAGHNPGGIHWSDDQGATWARGTAGAIGNLAHTPGPDFFSGFDRDAPIWALAGADDLLFAGASAGIYYSDDRGRSWPRAGAGLPATSPGISFFVNDRFVLAATLVESAMDD